jgi:F0F1-type ATP synthase delta subunit
MQDILKILVPIVVAHVVVLVAIIFVIKKMLLGDTMRAMERIKDVEGEVRKKEEGIRRQIEEHEKEFAKRKAELEEDLEQRRTESDREVARMKEQAMAEARTEGDRIIEQAKRNEEKFRQQIAQDMEEKAIEYGGQIFKLVFSEKMNSELNKQFIDELLDALEEVDSASITVDASDAEFTSSHTMEPEQKQRLEGLLNEKFGANIKVDEKVKEDLLGGLILKLGSLEIDGTLLNRYQEAVEEVKKSTTV